MKKVLVALTVICMLFCVASCSIDDSAPEKEVNSQNSAVETTAEPEDETAAESGDETAAESGDETWGLKETAVFDNLKVTALEMEESNGDGVWEPEKGNVFVGIKFEIENISDETQTISSWSLFDAYVDDFKCELSGTADLAFSDGSLGGSLSSGKKMVGWYAVEVSKDWKKLELEVTSDWLSSRTATFLFEK